MADTFEYDIHLRWSDADRQGHVNNGKFATFAEDARIEWFSQLPGREGSVPSSNLILARQEIDYHRQVLTEREPDKRMIMRCNTIEVGRTSARIREQLWSPDDAAPACTVVCVLVNFDYAAQRPQPWSEEQRAWILSYSVDEA